MVLRDTTSGPAALTAALAAALAAGLTAVCSGRFLHLYWGRAVRHHAARRGDGGVTLHRGDELRLELGEDLRELVLALALHAQAVEQRLLGRLGEESRGELSQGDGNQGGGVGGGEGRGGEGMGARGRLQHVVGGGN